MTFALTLYSRSFITLTRWAHRVPEYSFSFFSSFSSSRGIYVRLKEKREET